MTKNALFDVPNTIVSLDAVAELFGEEFELSLVEKIAKACVDTGYEPEYTVEGIYELIIGSDETECFVLMEGGKKEFVGFVCVEYKNERETYISEMFVLKNNRGKGFCKELIDYVSVLHEDTKLITLHVRSKNVSAIIAYLKSGFVVNGFIYKFYPIDDNDDENALSMLKELKGEE